MKRKQHKIKVEYVRAEPQPGDEDNVRAGYAILFEAVLEARKKRAQEAQNDPGNTRTPKAQQGNDKGLK